MASTVQIAVISILAILGVGAIGGGVFLSNFIDDELNSGIEDSLVISGINDEDYESWLTNEEIDDAPKFKKYYFWNLTNPENYLAGSPAEYEEVGPYVYRQFDRKIADTVVFNGPQVTYQTYTYYEFVSEDSKDLVDGVEIQLFETDVITNINPQYVGAITAAGGESQLLTSFVGTTMASIFDGLTTSFASQASVAGSNTALVSIIDGLIENFVPEFSVGAMNEAYSTIIEGFKTSFVPKVETQGLSDGLNQISTGVIDTFNNVINGTTVAQTLFGIWDGIRIATDADTAYGLLLNDINFNQTVGPTLVKGASNYTGGGLGISLASAAFLLSDGPVGLPIDGFFEDLVQGKGVLGFLAAYQSAVDPTDLSLNITTLGGAYGGMNATQLGAIAAWLGNHLIGEIANVLAPLSNSGLSTALAAEFMWYEQWANATIVPGGLDVDDDLVPDGVEAGFLGTTQLSMPVVQALFDSTDQLFNISTAEGIGTWLFAFGAALQGDNTTRDFIKLTYSGTGSGINDTQFTQIGLYLVNLRTNITTPGLLLKFGLTELDDIAYFQWGSSAITNGTSLFEIDPTSAPNYPEFWSWADRIASSTVTFTASEAKALYNGTKGMLNATELGTFLAFVGAGAFAGIEATWGINQTEAILLAGYFDYLLNEFAIPTFASLGVTEADDFAYLQFGQSILPFGVSVWDLDNTIAPNYTEFWAYASKFGLNDVTFDATEIKNLIEGATGFRDVTNMGLFLGLMAAGDLATVSTTWGLNTTEAIEFAGYFNYLINDFVLVELAPLGVTSVTDLGFLQWGNQILTGPLSTYDIDPTAVPNHVEFWSWASKVNSPSININLTATQTKALFNSSDSLLDLTNLVTFYTLLKTGNFAGIASTWGINQTEAILLAGYLEYVKIDIIGSKTFGLDGTHGFGYATGDIVPTATQFQNGLIVRRTITEWLWEGTDNFLGFISTQPGQEDLSSGSNLFTDYGTETGAEQAAKDDPKNVASTFNTGADDISQIGQYIKWKGQTSITGVWGSEEFVGGTDGTQFAPGLEKGDVVEAWVSELLRVVEFEFAVEDNTNFQLDLYKFILTEETLSASAANQQQFFQTINGMANMSSSAGLPLFVSKPHFLDSNVTQGGLNGLEPLGLIHDTYLSIEPTTGAVLDARKRLQISIYVEGFEYYSNGVLDNYMPIVWVEEGGTITEDQAKSFRDTVYGAQNLQQLAQIGGPAIGIVMLLSAVLIGVRVKSVKD